jgi:hypothetical protein
MVKVGPSANYYVRVRPAAWEDPDGDPALFAGIFHVDLQYLVGITFVPDVSDLAPPWTGASLPPSDEPVRTAGEARLSEALSSRYLVTPHPTLAGTTEQFSWSFDGPADEPKTVFFVPPPEFDRYLGELDELSEEAGGVHSTVKVDDIRDRYEVIRFIERRILDSPFLLRQHAAMLERPPA